VETEGEQQPTLNPLHRKLREDLHLAGGLAVVFEVGLRMLCEKHVETQRKAYKDLEKEVLQAVVSRFQKSLSDEDEALLRASVQLRNKLVHAQFAEANHLLERKFGFHETAVAKHVQLSEGESILDTLDKALEGQGTKEVRGLKQKDASTFGWYLEFGTKGGFRAAASVFRDAIALVDRLVHED
jgi:hypothetical protein